MKYECEQVKYVPFSNADLIKQNYAWYHMAILEKDYRFVETFWLSQGRGLMKPYFQCACQQMHHSGTPLPKSWRII